MKKMIKRICINNLINKRRTIRAQINKSAIPNYQLRSKNKSNKSNLAQAERMK